MSINANQYQNNSFLSVQRKRQALWNVLQPGDPYDIRKSMIAKVPFDKKTFMGDHIELVCLFQAAQIQRLSQFLDDFKIRYREIQRIKLDRHSYEVQIQQLTHRLAEQAVFRQENQKLKQFLKNQNLNKQGVQDSIKTKYQKLLVQAKNFQDQNNALKLRNHQLGSQISSFDAKFEALKKSLHSEYDEKMKQSLNTSISTQIEINSLKSQYESEVQRLDLQNKRIRQSIDDKTRQIQSWQSKYKILEQQLLRNSPKSQSKIAEYQNRFVIFGQEIDRLNLVIKQISNKFEISEQRNHQYETQYDALSKDVIFLQNTYQQVQDQNKKLLRTISQLENENRRIQQSGKLLKDYETKLREANEQILRLSDQLRVQLQNSHILREQVQRYQYEQSRIKLLEKELYEYQQSHENNNLKLKLAQDQNQVAMLKQQIQRLREELSKRNGLENTQRNLSIQNKSLASKLSDWEKKYQMTVQQYEMRINQKVSEYETRLQNINRTKGFQYQSKASMLQNELQRVSDLLKRKQQEADNYQKQVRELEYSITNKYELETSRKVQNYESAIQGLKRENQELIRRIRELEPLQRKVNEYENKFTITSQQIQRLTQHIRTRQNEIQNMRRQIRQQENAIIQKYEMDTSRKIGNYENILNDLKKQNQQLKRKYTQIENKAALLSQQIQRLTNNLRQFQLINSQYEQEIQRLQRYCKETQVNINKKYEVEINQKVTNYETAIRNQQRQMEELRRRVIDLENSNRKLVEYENQLKMADQQIERIKTMMRQKNQESVNFETNHRNLIREFEELGRKYNDLQTTVKNKFEVEATRAINTLEQNVVNLKRQNDELKRIIQELDLRTKKQQGDLEAITLNLRNSLQQNQALKRQMIELQNTFRNKLQVQVNGKYRSYESNISQIKRQFDNVLRQNNQLKKVLQNAQHTNNRLNQQNQELRRRFQHQFSQSSKRITDSDSKIHQLQNENEKIIRKILEFQNQNENLKRKIIEFQNENQTLKRKIFELQTVIRQKYEIQTARRISNLDQNLANSARQNQELRKRLQLSTREIDDLRRFAQKMEKDNQQLVQRLREFGEINKKVVEYQNKSFAFNQQLRVKNDNLVKAEAFIKELTQKLQNAERNISQSQSSMQQFEVEVKTKSSQYEHNLQLLNQQNTELKRRLNILDDMNRKIAENENKIMILNQELERMNINLKNQVDKYNQLENVLRNSSSENQNLRKNIIEIQNNIAQKYQVEATRTIRTLQQNLDGIQKENAQLKKVLQQVEQTLQAKNADIQKLTMNIKNLSDQNIMLKNQFKETEANIFRKYETQVKSRHSIYQQNLSGLARQNEELKKRLAEFQQQMEKIVRKINQLQNQNQNIRRIGKQTQIQMIQKFQVETTQQINIYKQQITQIQNQFRNAQKENQELVRRLNEFGGEANRKITHYEEQIKRVFFENQILTGRIRQYEAKLREFATENETLKRQLKQTEISLTQRLESELKLKITNFEQIISNNQREKLELQNTIKEISRSFQDKQMNLNNQASKRIAELQNKVTHLLQQLQHIAQNFRLRSEEMERMREQIERLNNTLRLKVEESRQFETEILKFKTSTQSQFSQLHSNFTLVTRENQNYKKHLIEYENSIKKLYGEFERLQNIINDLKRERQSLFEKNYALSTEIDRLLSENKDLEVQVEDVRLRLTDESALSRRVNEHLALMVVLFAEIESLRKRVKDKERQVEDVRRSSLAPFKLDKSRPKMDSI